MTRILERAGFALALLLAGVGANSVAMGLTSVANGQAHRAFVASQSSRQGVSPVPASIAFAGGVR